MSEVAHKFVHRAPRYVLRGSDNKILRYSVEGEHHTPIHTTTFVNVSLTGIAFITHKQSAPKEGDVIKLEFPVPGGDQIAWWGIVVRIEQYRPRRGWHLKSDFEIEDDVYVAVKFESLPEGHRHIITHGLQLKAKEIAAQRRAHARKDIFVFLKRHAWQLSIWIVCTILTFIVLFLLSQPTPNYSAERGAPWGRRFNF